MSYALDVAPEAWGAFHQLGIEVQEGILDEWERLAARPHSIPSRRHAREVVTASPGGGTLYVFFEIAPIHARHVFKVFTLGSLVRQP